jgi:hypothetical protein
MNGKILAAILAVTALLTLAACGGAPVAPSPTPTATVAPAPTPTATPSPSAAPEPTPTPEPVPTPEARAPMNEPTEIIDGMEALMGPSYEYYGEGAVHLEYSDDFVSASGDVVSIGWPRGWSLGELTIWRGDGGVMDVMVDVNDYTIVNNVAAAMYASCVRGVTPELGQKIADALHAGDMEFPDNFDRYTYVIDYEGYYYSYELANGLRLEVISTEHEPNFAKCVFFDIDGNEVRNPAAGTDGFDETGDHSATTGDAKKDALVQALTPPESSIGQATSDAVYIDSLTDYKDALTWYEETLPLLGFVSSIPEDAQELLNMDPESRIYGGTIDGQPVTIMVQDWSGTYGNGDMSLIMITFTAYGS